MIAFKKSHVPSLIAFSLLSVLIGSTFCNAAPRLRPAVPAPNLQEPPSRNDSPVQIRLGLYVADLALVDEASEDFEIQGYLYASWHDDRLVGSSSCQGSGRSLDPKKVWNPQLDIANLQTFKTFNAFFYCDPDGTVSWEERFDTLLSNEFFLRRFPFDGQTLVVTIQPFITPKRAGDNPIAFAARSDLTGVSNRAYLSAWKIEGITYERRSEQIDAVSLLVPQAQFEILVTRRSGFYVWKVFLPIILMVIVPWSVFWVSVEEFDWQMKIPIATMLAMVAFDFAIARDLPRVSYLTFLDAVFLASFIFIFLTMVEVITVHVLVVSDRLQLATRIHRSARWSFPLAYVTVVAILIPMFFIGAGRPQ
jgi:hypothetical protein